VLNCFGEFQRIVILGGKSDIALSILDKIATAPDAEIFLCGRKLKDFSHPLFNQFPVHKIEIDFAQVELAKLEIDKIFSSGDIDLVIIAFAILGSEELKLEPEEFKKVLSVNFLSQAILLNQINSKLLNQMHGQILQISSVAGMRPRRRNFVYGVSKFGVDFIAQGLQKENLGKNVYITILRPGFVHTKMTSGLKAAPFAIDSETVSRIAAKALLKKKRIVYAPKILSIIMFLLKLMPEPLFKRIDK